MSAPPPNPAFAAMPARAAIPAMAAVPPPQPSPRLRVALGGAGSSFPRPPGLLSPMPSTPGGGAMAGSSKEHEGMPPAAAAAAVQAAAATAAAASSAAASSSKAPVSSQSDVAPRNAKEKLKEARAAFKVSITQFAQLLTTPAVPITQQRLTQMEIGFQRVPQSVLTKVEQMHAQLLKEQQEAAEAAEEENANVILVNPEYPYQEPMIGPDYQIGVPNRAPAHNSKHREDELVWSPKPKEAASVDQYLSKVRQLIKGCETLTQKGDGAHHTDVFVEEMALETLEELDHNQTDALNALELCVAFQTGDEKSSQKIVALPRAAVVNSMLWLDRLSQAKRRRSWGDGEVEAMDWGLNHCQRDLIQMCRKTLQEKSKPELIEMYYHAPRKTAKTLPGFNAPKEPGSEPDPPPSDGKKAKGSKKD